ncbi:MAG: hypothetical protein SNJ59_02650 [Aggregatilineales bacterium]
MDSLLTALAIGVSIGLIAGIFIARRSAREAPIYGGLPALALHYVGASLFISSLPTALTSLILGRGLLGAVTAAFTCVIASLITFIVFAIVEAPARAARAPQEEEGWTAEKARTSGL